MLPNPVTWASHGNTTVGWVQCHGIFVCQSDSHHVDSHPQGPYCGWTHTHSILSLSLSFCLDSCTWPYCGWTQTHSIFSLSISLRLDSYTWPYCGLSAKPDILGQSIGQSLSRQLHTGTLLWVEHTSTAKTPRSPQPDLWVVPAASVWPRNATK